MHGCWLAAKPSVLAGLLVSRKTFGYAWLLVSRKTFFLLGWLSGAPQLLVGFSGAPQLQVGFVLGAPQLQVGLRRRRSCRLVFGCAASERQRTLGSGIVSTLWVNINPRLDRFPVHGAYSSPGVVGNLC
jgi:hypothetical protein